MKTTKTISGLRVKTSIKAGGMNMKSNHSASLVRVR